MSIPKYKKQYQEMLGDNKNLFESLENADRYSEDFKRIQREVTRIVRRNEDALCSKTENTHFSNFSTSLADRFMEEVRTNYPEIDFS